jgi:hypothetical protein
MSTGNLNGTLVAPDFWPACDNCGHFTTCQLNPRHPAFPHRWQWGKDSAPFSDGSLILRSWVGTTAIGYSHTGCLAYTVAARSLRPLRAVHREYLQLEAEKAQLDRVFTRLEQKEVWSQADERTYAHAFPRYKEVLERQANLRTSTPDDTSSPDVVTA